MDLGLLLIDDDAAEAAPGGAAGRLPRNIRQAEIIPQHELDRVAAVVVGCGAIGSWLGRFLAHVGVPYILLVDPDEVSYENLALQGYEERYVGTAKAEALLDALQSINDAVDIATVSGRFRGDHLGMVPEMYDHVAVFCCVDDIEVREFIHRAVRGRCALFVDGRMAAMVWRVLTVDDWGDSRYEATLFAKGEANVLRCTAKGTVFTAAAPALQMGTQLMLWVKGCRTSDGNLAHDVEGNLLSTTFEARFAES